MTTSEFAAIKKEVSQLKDGLGKPIDEGIFDTVAAMRALGINTIGSCEGHVDRVTGGPYVMFEAPNIQRYKSAYLSMPDRLGKDYRKAYQRAVSKNMYEVKKVLILLDDFYIGRVVPTNQRLTVQCFDTLAGKLMCQGGYLAHIMTRTERMELLDKNRLEIRAFTDFLLASKLNSPRTA